MAFETWGTTNYEVVSPLICEYSRTPVLTSLTPKQYRYTRHAMKTYLFKGMSEAAVKSCLEEKRQQYIRKFVAWRKNGSNYQRGEVTDDYFAQVATFNVTRREVVYDLQITVDETAVLYSTSDYDPLTTEGRGYIEGKFQLYGQPTDSYVSTWKYDEPGEDD